MTESLREVKLAASLCEAAERKFGARFGGIETLLEFVLRELLRDDAAEMDRNERRIIEQRLKDLGYL